MPELAERYYIGGSQKSILRDDEMYSRKLGLGLYKPDALRFFGEDRPTPSEDALWLPRETYAADDLLKQNGALIVTGDPGAGKSTVIYGIRKLFREEERPYCYYNGHFTSTKKSHIESAMNWTAKHDGVFVWDSFDYLIGSSGTIRQNISRGRARARGQDLLELTQTYVEEGMEFVGTSHNEEWVSNHGDPSTIESHWKPFLADKPALYVEGTFETPEELEAFYDTVGRPEGLTDQDISFFSTLPERIGDPDIAASLSTYLIAKQICQDRRPEWNELMDRYRLFREGSLPDETFQDAMCNYIAIKHAQRQQLMGVSVSMNS